MDDQGGEKIERLAELYAVLANDSLKKAYNYQPFYYLTRPVLRYFKYLQGFDRTTKFCGTRIQQAATIWRSPPQHLTRAIMEANFPGLNRDAVLSTRITDDGKWIEQPSGNSPSQIIIDPRDASAGASEMTDARTYGRSNPLFRQSNIAPER